MFSGTRHPMDGTHVERDARQDSIKVGIFHRSTHTSLRIRGRRRTKVEPPHPLGGAALPVPTYRTIFSHTSREISLHPPVDESGCSCSAQGAPSFYIMLGRSSVLMSLSIEDETSIPRLISLHPTCLRSRLQQTLISSFLPFYTVELYTLLATLARCLTLTLTLTLTLNGPNSQMMIWIDGTAFRALKKWKRWRIYLAIGQLD